MKTLQNRFTSPEKQFIITNKHVNKNNALLPIVLNNEMEQLVKKIIVNNPNLTFTSPQLFKLHLLKNAFLNNTLLLKAQITKFNETTLHIQVIVKQKNKRKNSTICKAVFKIPIEENILIAS